MKPTVYLVKGGDPVLMAAAVKDLVSELVGDGDRSLLVEELNEASYKNEEDYSITPLADAAQTPPFLTERRVVVGREIGRFGKADDLRPLLAYLENPLDSTDLVLVWEKGPNTHKLANVNKALVKAIGDAQGNIIETNAPRNKRELDGWWEERVAESGVDLTMGARKLLADHLGEDRARLPAVLKQLLSTFGPGVPIDNDDIAPYLGQAGDVAPWDLTDAMASGRTAVALDKLQRMTQAGGRHGLAVLATLHRHYGQILRLDGSHARDEKAAAQILGMKGSTYPAKKALTQSRKMGSERAQRAIAMIAQADLDLRGATAVDSKATLEVLVARLTRLSA